jgi:hypothetical protein
MSDDGVPVYVRQVNAPDLTHHRPQHVYETDLRLTPGGCPIYSSHDKKVICQLTTNTRESFIWCRECGQERHYTQLKKSYAAMGIATFQVWQDTDQINLSTGRVETDPRKFREHLHVQSEIASERLGMKVDYQPVDMTDRDALGVTDEGLDATHDAQVKSGQKDSRGRFVW